MNEARPTEDREQRVVLVGLRLHGEEEPDYCEQLKNLVEENNDKKVEIIRLLRFIRILTLMN